jgi:hypothetical protein
MKKILVLTVIFCLNSGGYSQSIKRGGESLIHVSSARVMKKGGLELYSNLYFFSRVGKIYDTVKTDSLTDSKTFWDLSNIISVSYGLTNIFDISFTTRMYQSNIFTQSKLTTKADKLKQHSNNLPDNFNLSFKAGSFTLFGILSYGVLANLRVQTGGSQNIPLEPYMGAGRVEWAFTGLLSYNFDPAFPDESFSVHLNLGYQNHMDAGSTIQKAIDSLGVEKELKPENNAQEILFGIALRYPSNVVDLQLEIWGNNFAVPPPNFVYGRESFIYITPGIRWKAYRWLSVDLNADIRISEDKDETEYNTKEYIITKPPVGLPNYNTWKFNIGFNFVILPLKISTPGAIEYKTAQQRKKAYEKLVEGKAKIQAAEQELESIKDQRKEAEKSYEDLKKLLEGKEETKTEKKEKRKTKSEEKSEQP